MLVFLAVVLAVGKMLSCKIIFYFVYSLRFVHLSEVEKFPIEEFYPKWKYLFQDDTGTKDVILCSEVSAQMRCCSCQPDCWKYRQCCVDYLWLTDPHAPRNMTEYKDYLIKKSLSEPQLSCVSFSEEHKYEFLVTDRCKMQNVNGQEISKVCQSTKYESGGIDIPVLGDKGQMYINKDCALCNRETNIMNVDMKLSGCSVPDNNMNNTNMLKHLNTCHVCIDSHEAKRCELTMDDPLEEPGMPISELCNAYTGPVFFFPPKTLKNY